MTALVRRRKRWRRSTPTWPGTMLLLAATLGFTGTSAWADKPIRLSIHNLSLSGPAATRSSSESEICIFCHGTHGIAPSAPLWNRNSSGAIYTPYRSSTLKAHVGQPTGASAVCLSCHDGTVAMGKVRNRKAEIRMSGNGGSRLTGRRANLGTDLSDDHPISFTYDSGLVNQSNGELRDPVSFRPEVKLDRQRQLQCTSCHEPHDNTYGKFLVMDNHGSALCLVCHNKQYWEQSVHRTSGARWNGAAPHPWPYLDAKNVAEAGCENCHTPHKAGTPERLLVFQKAEDNCLFCHNGNVAKGNLIPEFGKLSRHDIRGTTGVHDPAENIARSSRHVACVDCHNPHGANGAPATAPQAPGSLAGVAGVSASGSVITQVTREYELCFRCHADSTGKGEASVPRDKPETNTRLEFNTGNASFHPVEGPGRNPDVPSLIAPLRPNSLIYCTDCHNNNQGPRAGGKGPDGPHGSAYAPLLERKLEFRDFLAESAASYALCYKCHSRDSILGNQSFPLHAAHVAASQTACTTCHDSHGMPGASHLINFNRMYVTANGKGLLNWSDEGSRQGSCNLSCHGKDHDNLGYDRNGTRPVSSGTVSAQKLLNKR
ncbi:MAG: cytochrome c3 family protein [bacterium]